MTSDNPLEAPAGVPTAAPSDERRMGLHNLSQVELNAANLELLDGALEQSGGDAAWRARKKREAHELLALSQIAPPGRLVIEALDLRESLRAMIGMGVPVPTRPNAHNQLGVAPWALLGLNYPPEAVRQALPGPAFVQILLPREVWLPQVRWPDQPLCLGVTLPAGIRVRSVVMLAYGALSMQTTQVNEIDPAGVFHVEAAQWWQQNLRYAPLTRTAFLAPYPTPPAPRPVASQPGG